jgi:PAS domain S-box-containing protein
MYSGGSLYRSLFTAHPLATWIVAGDTLRILDANAAAVAFANRPLDELIGRFAPDLALPDDADAFAAQLRDPAATPNRVGRFPGLDGNERLVSVHVQPFAVDGKTLLTVVLQDVTARVRSAIRRRQNEERQALIARTVSDASWDWNLTTDALWWDESVERLFGYPRAEIGPDIHWWAERIHPEDRERIERSLAEAFATGADQWEGEYRFRRADGR